METISLNQSFGIDTYKMAANIIVELVYYHNFWEKSLNAPNLSECIETHPTYYYTAESILYGTVARYPFIDTVAELFGVENVKHLMASINLLREDLIVMALGHNSIQALLLSFFKRNFCWLPDNIELYIELSNLLSLPIEETTKSENGWKIKFSDHSVLDNNGEVTFSSSFSY